MREQRFCIDCRYFEPDFVGDSGACYVKLPPFLLVLLKPELTGTEVHRSDECSLWAAREE